MKKTRKKYNVEKVFIKEPWKELTYSEIQKITKIRAKRYIYTILKRLNAERMIEVKEIGKSKIYSPILDKSSAQSYWGFLAEHSAWSKNKFPFQIIENLRNKIPTPFFILLVTGSYARGTQTSKSDLDVVVITGKDSKEVYAELKHESQISIPQVHLYVFNEKEFLEMLLSKKENYGKEIARNNLIFFGGASYLSILSEAVNHGFKD